MRSRHWHNEAGPIRISSSRPSRRHSERGGHLYRAALLFIVLLAFALLWVLASWAYIHVPDPLGDGTLTLGSLAGVWIVVRFL